MRDDSQTRKLRRDLRNLLPADKNDLVAVDALIARGYPTVDPILLDILKWIRQPQWPVADPLAKFLLSLGPALLPHIHRIFSSSRDEQWKAEILRTIVQYWPADQVAELTSYLTVLATHGQSWGVDLISLRLLAHHRLAEREWIARWLDFKRQFHQGQLHEIECIRQLNSNGAA